MKTNFLFIIGAAVGALLFATSPLHAQGTAFTYQGRLNNGGNPAGGSYDFRFRLASDALGNNYVGGPVLSNALPVSGGLFTVTLDFGSGVFAGSNYWLQVEVKTNGASGYSTLAPLQSLTPAPYAVFAGTAGNLSGTLPSGQLAGTYSGAVTFNNANDAFSGNGGGLANLNAGNLSSGTVPAAALGNAWKTTGNTNASPTNGNFLGTMDNQPIEFKAGGLRVLRLEPDSRGGIAGNLIGGSTNNTVEQPGSGGDVIGGGGYISGPNIIHSNSSGVFIGAGSANQIGPNINDSFIGAGYGNTNQSADSVIAGGINNSIRINAPYSAIGGGDQNTIQTNGVVGVAFATIGGGQNNIVSTQNATIGGGYANTASGAYATVGGGSFNVAGGGCSTVPGGDGNHALGDFSFAAGWNAYATHYGSFVWSDQSSSFVFGSTTSNQFSARAFGGVSFSTGGAGMTLDGQPVVTTTALGSLNAANITNGTLADARLSANVALLNRNQTFAGIDTFNNNVGIAGTLSVDNITPSSTLTVAGDVQMQGGASYHHLQLSGGNSYGFLYGSFPAFGDGVHLGYNYYADANGAGHVLNPGGGTSRISAGYADISMFVGDVNTAPATLRLDATTAGVSVYGTFNNFSDRNAKQDFAPVSSSQILDKVMRLPVSEWSYKVDAATRHIGPMAQDFYSVFNIGTDDRHIAPIDEGGVALAAIQALNQKLELDTAAQKQAGEARETKIQNLEKENENLRLRLEKIEQWMARTDVAAK